MSLLDNRLRDGKSSSFTQEPSDNEIERWSDNASDSIMVEDNGEGTERTGRNKGYLSSIESLGAEDGDAVSEEDAEELRRLEMGEDELPDEKAARREKIRKSILMTVLAVICAYLVMMIYGVFTTSFVYKDGKIVAEVLSTQDIKDRNNYEELLAQYLNARMVYEHVLKLDYRVALGKEDMIELGSEYQEEIAEIKKMYTLLEGSTLHEKYVQVGQMLHSFLYGYLQTYCYDMSVALSENNADASNEAILAKSDASDMFYQVHQNIVSLGKEIKGIDLTDVEEWTPDKYVKQELMGQEQ